MKSEGLVHKSEFDDWDTLESGVEIEVILEDLEDENGIVKLSSKNFRFNVTSLLTETLTSEDGCPVVSQLIDRDIPLICDGNLGQHTSLTCNPDMKAIVGGFKNSIIEKFGRKTTSSELEKGMNLLELMEQLFD